MMQICWIGLYAIMKRSCETEAQSTVCIYFSNAIRNDDNMALLPSVQLRHIALNRNKRCVLAYIYNRMRMLRDLRWELGSILPPEVNSNLLNAEVQWFQSYNKSLATYMRSLGEDQGFNLTVNMLPPKAPYVEVNERGIPVPEDVT